MKLSDIYKFFGVFLLVLYSHPLQARDIFTPGTVKDGYAQKYGLQALIDIAADTPDCIGIANPTFSDLLVDREYLEAGCVFSLVKKMQGNAGLLETNQQLVFDRYVDLILGQGSRQGCPLLGTDKIHYACVSMLTSELSGAFSRSVNEGVDEWAISGKAVEEKADFWIGSVDLSANLAWMARIVACSHLGENTIDDVWYCVKHSQLVSPPPPKKPTVVEPDDGKCSGLYDCTGMGG